MKLVPEGLKMSVKDEAEFKPPSVLMTFSASSKYSFRRISQVQKMFRAFKEHSCTRGQTVSVTSLKSYAKALLGRQLEGMVGPRDASLRDYGRVG